MLLMGDCYCFQVNADAYKSQLLGQRLDVVGYRLCLRNGRTDLLHVRRLILDQTVDGLDALGNMIRRLPHGAEFFQNFARGIAATVGKFPDLLRHNREAAPRLARAGSLNGGI